MNVLKQVRTTIERYGLLAGDEPLVVGVSGGPDSLCLLHVLQRLSAEYRLALHVAHLDHGTRDGESAADARFVSGVAGAWGLPCTVEAQDVPGLAREKGVAFEEMARRVRYDFLARVADRIGARRIAVGHNADDQTETVLMHWLRGAGLAGLRGMLPVTEVRHLRLAVGDERWRESPLFIVRPLLEVPRAEVEAYCARHGLEPRFDLSNLDTTYYRNRLRHELIPFLETYNPNIREVLRRSARVIADDYALLRRELARAWERVVTAESDEAIAFDLARWRALPISLQRSTLREAVHRLRWSLRNINWVHIEDALWVARTGTAGRQATLPQRLMLTLGYDHFTVADENYTPPDPDWPLLAAGDRLPLAVPGTTPLPGGPWRVEAAVLDRAALPGDWAANPDRWQAWLDFERTGTELMVRGRQPGDRFQPLGLGGRATTLREFMINVKIPARLRDRVPVVISPQHIVWLAGWRVDERARVTDDTRRVLHLRFVRET